MNSGKTNMDFSKGKCNQLGKSKPVLIKIIIIIMRKLTKCILKFLTREINNMENEKYLLILYQEQK